jgi:hypothetical protein
MARTSFADIVVDGEQLNASLAANAADLPHLEPQRLEMAALLVDIKTLSTRQDAEKAAVQQTTKEMTEKVTLVRQLSTRLRAGVMQFYGNKSEKLVEFGMKPFRKRLRTLKAAKKPTAPLPPSDEPVN